MKKYNTNAQYNQKQTNGDAIPLWNKNYFSGV